jgi:CheY-like chemotaxis protein
MGYSLLSRRLLVVEDDVMLNGVLCYMLQEEGAEVVGSPLTVAKALEIVASGLPIDAALLDVELRRELIHPVADALARRGIPFVFVTATELDALHRRYPRSPLCGKPCELETLREAIIRAISSNG